jgi:hypothetical protein
MAICNGSLKVRRIKIYAQSRIDITCCAERDQIARQTNG